MDRLSETVAEIALEQGALDVFIADTPEKTGRCPGHPEQDLRGDQVRDNRDPGHLRPARRDRGHVKRVRDLEKPVRALAADLRPCRRRQRPYPYHEGPAATDGRFVPLPEAEWREKFEQVREEIIADGIARGGVISGEHGIGLVKKITPGRARLPPEQIELMRGIKRAFDPNGILNPGKIFD